MSPTSPIAARSLHGANPSLASRLLVALCLLVSYGVASGESARTLNLPILAPTPPGKPVYVPPWLIEVDFSGVEGQMYRGIKITVTSNSGPVTADHTLTVAVATESSDGNNFDEKVTAYIYLPEGQTSVTTFVNVPDRSGGWNGHSYFVVLREHGEDLKGCRQYINPLNSNQSTTVESTSIVVIDPDAPTRAAYIAAQQNGTIVSSKSVWKDRHLLPDVRWLVATLMGTNRNDPSPYNTETYDDAQLLQTLGDQARLDFVQPSELPDNWLSLSNADLIVITRPDLQDLRSKRPGQFAALLAWTQAGGNLLVFQCGENWGHLTAIDELLGLSHDQQVPGKTANWQLPERTNFRIRDDDNTSRYSGPRNVFTRSTLTTNSDEITSDDLPPDGPQGMPEQMPFAYRHLGLGTVVAYHSENPFPGLPRDWGGLWHTLGQPRLLAQERLGVSHSEHNGGFWNFLIPGVGEAPVFSFMTMIALFMLLIGPVNYQLLRRYRRLSLLLITVPLGAGLFTLGLFSFAVFSDGFSTRTRVRSFTVLEPVSQRAASISRQNYYMAFVPSEGMQYPADTGVFPLLAESNRNYSMSNNQTESRWLDGKLQLQRRYLSAREHRQFITLRSTPCTARLEVRPQGTALQVTNRLGSDIELGIVSDAEGNLFYVSDLAADDSGTAIPIESYAARSLWAEHSESKQPRLPENLHGAYSGDIFSSRSTYFNSNDGLAEGSMLERQLRDIDARLTHLPEKPNATQPRLPHPKYFVAITKDSVVANDGEPLAPLGIRATNVVQSLHVVRGSW